MLGNFFASSVPMENERGTFLKYNRQNDASFGRSNDFLDGETVMIHILFVNDKRLFRVKFFR